MLSKDIIDSAFSKVPDIQVESIKINSRLTRLHGLCRKRNGKFYIELSSKMLRYGDDIIEKTLIHEMLHCIDGCQNHGPKWKMYAKQFGITRTCKLEGWWD